MAAHTEQSASMYALSKGSPGFPSRALTPENRVGPGKSLARLSTPDLALAATKNHRPVPEITYKIREESENDLIALRQEVW